MRIFSKLDEKPHEKNKQWQRFICFSASAIEVMLQCLKLEAQITEQKQASQVKIQLKETDGLREYVCDCEG